jgi:nitrogen fixation/metabolism regulation signal transduction histidine kinase
MTEKTINMIEEALRKEVQKIDKSVQVVAVEQGKKKDFYRVTLLKEGKSASADLQKNLIEQYLAQKDKGRQLRKALAKAVSHLSIRYGR